MIVSSNALLGMKVASTYSGAMSRRASLSLVKSHSTQIRFKSMACLRLSSSYTGHPLHTAWVGIDTPPILRLERLPGTPSVSFSGWHSVRPSTRTRSDRNAQRTECFAAVPRCVASSSNV